MATATLRQPQLSGPPSIAKTQIVYRHGFQWWLTPSLEAIAAEVQNAFLEDDTWDELIADWIELKAGRDIQSRLLLPFSTRAVLRGLGYGLSPEEGNQCIVAAKGDEIRVTRCLKRLG